MDGGRKGKNGARSVPTTERSHWKGGAYLDPGAGGTPTLAVCCCPGQGKVIAVGPMIAGIETRNWEPEEEGSCTPLLTLCATPSDPLDLL